MGGGVMNRSIPKRAVGILHRWDRSMRIAVLGIACLLIPGLSQASEQTFTLVETIAFSSTRDDPTVLPAFNAAEIYLINADGSDPRRLTENSFGDGFATLSPDGKKIVFDSNRNRAEGEPINTSDLFLMNTDGTEQSFLTRGGSPTWAPDSKDIAFHASASGTGLPVLGTPGAATTDSDIFAANVDDLLTGLDVPRNITNSPNKIDDDPDWSRDGERIVFTNHDVNEPNHNNAVSAEIYTINTNGTGTPERLTFNAEEERAPAWSLDGTRIAFMCRRGGADFEICGMGSDGSDQGQLTDNAVIQ